MPTGSTSLTVTAPLLASIAVTPANASVPKGIALEYMATGTYSNNSTQNLTSSVTWTSSNTSAATITSAGLATGVNTGSTTIQATSGTISGTTNLTVTSGLVSIAVTPANGSIPKGTTQQCTATGIYSDNSTLNYRALSATEVQQLYQAGSATGSLVAPSLEYASIANGPADQFVANGILDNDNLQDLAALLLSTPETAWLTIPPGHKRAARRTDLELRVSVRTVVTQHPPRGAALRLLPFHFVCSLQG